MLFVIGNSNMFTGNVIQPTFVESCNDTQLIVLIIKLIIELYYINLYYIHTQYTNPVVTVLPEHVSL